MRLRLPSPPQVDAQPDLPKRPAYMLRTGIPSPDALPFLRHSIADNATRVVQEF